MDVPFRHPPPTLARRGAGLGGSAPCSAPLPGPLVRFPSSCPLSAKRLEVQITYCSKHASCFRSKPINL
eukprot:scaffold129018_cov37-Tisochrysis_lutea.AAC.1